MAARDPAPGERRGASVRTGNGMVWVGWIMSPASSIETVFKEQYPNVSATDQVILLTYIPCHSLQIGSPGFSSTLLPGDVLIVRWGCSLNLGLYLAPYEYPYRAELSHNCALQSPSASITLCMAGSAWLGVAADIEEESVQVKAMLATPGLIVRRPQSNHWQKLHYYMAMNQHVKYGNIPNMFNMWNMHIYAFISFICKQGNYMQFLYMQNMYVYVKCQILQICKICKEVAYWTPDLNAALTPMRSGLKYAVLHILHRYEKMSTHAKYGKEVFMYAAKSIHYMICMQLSPYFIICACSQWSSKVENSCGNVSSFACNQLCLLSEPVAANYSMLLLRRISLLLRLACPAKCIFLCKV